MSRARRSSRSTSRVTRCTKISDPLRGSWSWRAGIGRSWRRRHATAAARSELREPAAYRLLEQTMPSFDVVSELNAHELTNAVDQANRELSQRFDFKNTGAVYELEERTVTLKAQVDFQLKQMLEILKIRLAK